VANYRLTDKAQSEISLIYKYSIENFGLAKAQDYVSSFQEAFAMIFDNPLIGRDVSFVKEGYRRYEHASHSIYYKAQKPENILIVRVLGASQDPITNI